MINNSNFEGTGRTIQPNVLVLILKFIIFTPYDAPKSLKIAYLKQTLMSYIIVRGDRDSRANLMPIYGDLYQIKL